MLLDDAVLADALFPDFLEDPEEYKRCETYWLSLWGEILSQNLSEDKWQAPYYGTAFVDGTEMKDGNPIFSAICLEKNIALRIIQGDPGCELFAYFVHWDDLAGINQEITELVISLILTPDTVSQARDLIAIWLKKNNA